MLLQQTAPSLPTPPPTPTAPLTAAQVVVDGNAITLAQATYQGFVAQRRELSRQLEALEDSRQSISSELQSTALNEVDKKGLEQRLAATDERIISVEKQLTEAQAQVARAAGIPGAAIEMPEPPRSGPPEEAFVLAGMFMFIVFLPLSIAYARRVWRKSAKVVAEFPKELAERLMRVEQAVDATAVEVERIGEGQRFMTKLFTEGPAAQALRGQHQERIAAQSGGAGSP